MGLGFVSSGSVGRVPLLSRCFAVYSVIDYNPVYLCHGEQRSEFIPATPKRIRGQIGVELQKLQGKSHRRYNPLTRDWILVSPNRSERPWQGQTENFAP